MNAKDRQKLFNYFDSQHGIILLDEHYNEIENILKEHIEQTAKDFDKWKVENKWITGNTLAENGEVLYVCIAHVIERQFKTTSELFEIFKTQTT